MAEIADYQWLTGPEATAWLAEVAAWDEPGLRLLERLRKMLSAERSRLLVAQLTLRRRARAKFGPLAERMFFSDLGLQQATDLWIARGAPVVDFCCGIGGDLLALAERGLVVGWDRAAEVACLAKVNLREVKCVGDSCVRVGSAEDQVPAGDEVWHLDPDRRVEGRRSTQVRWHSPGPDVINRWLQSAPQGILKLAPAAVVPEPWQREAELEWISRDRQCRQLVVWFGELAAPAGQRRATVLKSPLGYDSQMGDSQMVPSSFQGDPDMVAPLASDLQQYVYEVDPAIRAAKLAGAFAIEHHFAALAPGTAYFTSDHPLHHPLLACFQVIDRLPLRIGPLKNYLQSKAIGCLEIKKRGVKVDLERLRKQLKLRGSDSATLLLGQLGLREIAILARRCNPEVGATG